MGNIVFDGTLSGASVAYAANAGNTNSVTNAVGGAYTWTGLQAFQMNKGSSSYLSSNSSYHYIGYSTDLGAAAFSFHRAGSYAVNMGLDPDNVIRIGGWSAPGNLFQMDMGGNLTMAGNVTAYSDERLKTNWRVLPINFVKNLATVRSGIFDRIDSGETQVGLSAQDIQSLLPEAVTTNANGLLSLNYGALSGVAIVELCKEAIASRSLILQHAALIDSLISRIAALEESK